MPIVMRAIAPTACVTIGDAIGGRRLRVHCGMSIEATLHPAIPSAVATTGRCANPVANPAAPALSERPIESASVSINPTGEPARMGLLAFRWVATRTSRSKSIAAQRPIPIKITPLTEAEMDFGTKCVENTAIADPDSEKTPATPPIKRFLPNVMLRPNSAYAVATPKLSTLEPTETARIKNRFASSHISEKSEAEGRILPPFVQDRFMGDL